MSYRILSLDGGGIRGVISAVILAEVERLINQPLNEYFDLIAGTSTGSILGTAVATGSKSQEVIQLYQQQGKNIFPYQNYFSPKRLKLLFKHGISAPKFSDQGLIEVMQEQFGTMSKLSDIPDFLKLIIISYDTLGREPIVFKSWYEYFADVPLWEACVCSSSAPTYFPAHLLNIQGRSYSAIDGGMGATNPSACAVAEAIRLKHPIEEISVLSIGTGDSSHPIPWQQAGSWGLLDWGWEGRLIGVMFDASSDIHNYITKQVMSEPDIESDLYWSRYLRLDPKIEVNQIDNATTENINRLIDLTKQYLQSRSYNQPEFTNQQLLEKFLGITNG